MAAWLVEHFLWVALFLVVVAIGLKIVIAAFLRRLMDESAASEEHAAKREAHSKARDTQAD